MANERHRITDQARRELVDAVAMDQIDNATRFAQEFAARHGLNPSTVRSSISRLRRDLGLLKRRRPAEGGLRSEGIGGWESGRARQQLTAMEVLIGGDVTNPALARVAAAVLLRYQDDVDFRRAVDRHRPEIEKMAQRVSELREMSEDLSRAERAELLRLLQR